MGIMWSCNKVSSDTDRQISLKVDNPDAVKQSEIKSRGKNIEGEDKPASGKKSKAKEEKIMHENILKLVEGLSEEVDQRRMSTERSFNKKRDREAGHIAAEEVPKKKRKKKSKSDSEDD